MQNTGVYYNDAKLLSQEGLALEAQVADTALQNEARKNLLAQQSSNPGRVQTTQTKRRNYLNTSNSSQFLTNASAPQRSLLNLGQ